MYIFIANSANYLHLSILVHYKTVRNNNLMYILIQIIKWMSPYWDNKALPTPTVTLPESFICNFLVISFIFIEQMLYY